MSEIKEKMEDINSSIVSDYVEGRGAFKDDKPSEPFFDHCIKLDKDFAYALYMRGILLLQKDECDSAIECFNNAIINYQKTKERYESYERTNEKFSSLIPPVLKIHKFKGDAFHSKAAHEDAIRCYQYVINTTTSVNQDYTAVIKELRKDTYLNMAIAFMDRNMIPSDIESAIKYIESSLEIQPNYMNAIVNKGLAFCRLGKYDLAAKLYEEFPDKKNCIFALYDLGHVYKKRGMIVEATEHFQNVIKLQSSMGRKLQAWEILYIGHAFTQLGLFDDAIDCFEKTIGKIYPKAHALYGLGLVCQYRKDKEGALNYYREIKERSPNFREFFEGKLIEEILLLEQVDVKEIGETSLLQNAQMSLNVSVDPVPTSNNNTLGAQSAPTQIITTITPQYEAQLAQVNENCNFDETKKRSLANKTPSFK